MFIPLGKSKFQRMGTRACSQNQIERYKYQMHTMECMHLYKSKLLHTFSPSILLEMKRPTLRSKSLTCESNRIVTRPTAAKKPIDHILVYLRELQLPIIWIVGLPSRKIFQIRRDFCKQLAKKFEFGYINIDDEIDKWRERQFRSSQEDADVSAENNPRKENARRIEKIYFGTSLAKQYFRDINVRVAIPYDLEETTQYALLMKSSGSDIQLHQGVNMDDYLYDEQESATQRVTKNCKLSRQRINFNLANVFTPHMVLELLKFAMIENLPAKGFVIEGVPYELEEAEAFEKFFYPAALGIFFCEGKGKNEIVRTSKRHRQLPSQVPTEPVAIASKHIKRLKPFSLAQAEKICNVYGHKIIRIIHAEDVDKDTIEFINNLVKKNLEHYPDILTGTSRIDDYSQIPSRTSLNTHLEKSSTEQIHCSSSDMLLTAFSSSENVASVPQSRELIPRQQFASTSKIGKEEIITKMRKKRNLASSKNKLEKAKDEMLKTMLDGKVDEILKEMKSKSSIQWRVEETEERKEHGKVVESSTTTIVSSICTEKTESVTKKVLDHDESESINALAPEEEEKPITVETVIEEENVTDDFMSNPQTPASVNEALDVTMGDIFYGSKLNTPYSSSRG